MPNTHVTHTDFLSNCASYVCREFYQQALDEAGGNVYTTIASYFSALTNHGIRYELTDLNVLPEEKTVRVYYDTFQGDKEIPFCLTFNI